MPSESDPAHKWYMVHALSGHEAKVAEALTQRVEAAGLKGEVSEILVPIETAAGVGKPGQRKVFPGYILMKMAISEAIKQLVKATPKVTGFVGGQQPTPLSEDEVKSIVGKARTEPDVRRINLHYDIGDTVRITDGAFANFTGVIKQDDRERGVLLLTISVAGRVTEVEVKYSQVEKGA